MNAGETRVRANSVGRRGLPPRARRLMPMGVALLAVGLGWAAEVQAQVEAQPEGIVVQRTGIEPAPLAEDAPSGDPTSPWYLERGPWRRLPRPDDDLAEIDVAFALARLTRDEGRLPGFYDGQFAATAGDFDALARLASDPDIHPTMRMLAVMALQEAGDGAAVAAVLDPLIMSATREYQIERTAYADPGFSQDESWTEEILAADLSSYARFALAKDGQPERIREKIKVMEEAVRKERFEILDPLVSSRRNRKVRLGRWTWFQIGYHYQQFDDYERARAWYEALCDSLPGDDWTGAPHYNLACIAALTERPADAIAHLQAAYDVGYLMPAWMEEDGDLVSLRDRADYHALLATMLGGEAPAFGADGEPGAETGSREGASPGRAEPGTPEAGTEGAGDGP